MRKLRRYITWSFVISVVLCVVADWWVCLPKDSNATYVGRQSCIDCHPKQSKKWSGSHHDLAMDRATDLSVLGDFNDTEFTHSGVTSRMYRDGNKFMVHTEGPQGKPLDFEVKYTFGVEPLQQYLVEMDRPADMDDDDNSRVQVLPICWDTTASRWFYLAPPDSGGEHLSPDDPLYWTNHMQNWNYQCADCHSTNVQRDYDFDSNTYHTSFSEIDVSCEACHGPGSIHVGLARSWSLFWDRKIKYGLARLKGRDSDAEIEMCASCHSRRRMIYPGYRAGDNYHDFFVCNSLSPDLYYPDGQILDEVYVYGSFIQSKMYAKGVRCSDCHDPHTARLKFEGNQVCTSCHQHPAGKYDTPAHHHHPPGSSGDSCVACHMPSRTYMDVDPRRDHSLRVPRPDLSIKLGTPNACSGCHLEKANVNVEQRQKLGAYENWLFVSRGGDATVRKELARVDRWCQEKIELWYGERTLIEQGVEPALLLAKSWRGDPRTVGALSQMALDSRVSSIWRTSAIDELRAFEDKKIQNVMRQLLSDRDPRVRNAAVEAYGGFANDLASLRRVVSTLSERLEDPVRAVRLSAVGQLAYFPADALNGQQRQMVGQRVKQVFDVSPATTSPSIIEMNRGIHLERMAVDPRGLRRAADAYRSSIRLAPESVGPRSNLAGTLEALADSIFQRESKEADRLRVEVKELRQQELALLDRDVGKLPPTVAPRLRAALWHRYGLALYLDGQIQESRKVLENAVSIAPNQPQILFILGKLYQEYRELDRAQKVAFRLIRLRPENRMYRAFLREVEEDNSR